MKLTIRADGFEGWAERGRERAERLSRREMLEPEMTINFESPLAMLECLTAERMRLFKAAQEKVYSVSELAAALKRDPKSVRRDVRKLEQADAAHTAGDQSGTWSGEDRGAGGTELRAAGEILGLGEGERFAKIPPFHDETVKGWGTRHYGTRERVPFRSWRVQSKEQEFWGRMVRTVEADWGSCGP